MQAKHTDQIARISEAEHYRLLAGLTTAQVGRRVGLGGRYVRQGERSGFVCYATARQIARVVGCPVTAYLRPRMIELPASRYHELRRALASRQRIAGRRRQPMARAF